MVQSFPNLSYMTAKLLENTKSLSRDFLHNKKCGAICTAVTMKCMVTCHIFVDFSVGTERDT